MCVQAGLEIHELSFDEVERVLGEREADSLFPVQFYRAHAIRSMIARSRGDMGAARTHAEAALREAAKTHYGFRYHAAAGLVGDTDTGVRKQLEEILNHS